MKDQIIDSISDVCCIAKDRIKLDVPLENQMDIDSLDCAEIEQDIQDKLSLEFDMFSVASTNLTPQAIIDNVQKLLDKKKVDEEANKKALGKIIRRSRLF